LGKQFTPHDLCEENHKRRVEATVQALFKTVDNDSPERIRPCDLKKLINSQKLHKACGIDGIPNDCLKVPSKKTIGSFKSFNESLHSVFTLSHILAGSESDSLT
jgi:hypothetical protein